MTPWQRFVNLLKLDKRDQTVHWGENFSEILQQKNQKMHWNRGIYKKIWDSFFKKYSLLK